MEFNQNKTPTEVIKEDAFGGTYFRDIYLGVNGKQYGKSWNKFDDLLILMDGFNGILDTFQIESPQMVLDK